MAHQIYHPDYPYHIVRITENGETVWQFPHMTTAMSYWLYLFGASGVEYQFRVASQNTMARYANLSSTLGLANALDKERELGLPDDGGIIETPFEKWSKP
jgi:hypothetical protein